MGETSWRKRKNGQKKASFCVPYGRNHNPMILKCCAQTTLDKPEGGEQKAQAEASSFAGIQDDSDYRCFQTDFYLTQTH